MSSIIGPRENVSIAGARKRVSVTSALDREGDTGERMPNGAIHILNDLVVDRGPSAYMSQLELYVDGHYLTTVQADGLVVCTPTGL